MMMKRVVVLAIAVLLLLPAISGAVGPLDGSYKLEGGFSPFPEYPAYVVVLQTGDQVGLAVLDTYTAGWLYGFGPLTGNRVAGDLFYVDNVVIGQFDFTFGPESVFNGTITDIFDSETPPIPVVGRRFF